MNTKRKGQTAFGQNLHQARRAMGMKQRELAEKMDTTISSVSNWEQKNREPCYADLLKLADIFGIDVEDLLRKHPDDTWVIGAGLKRPADLI